MIESEQLLAEYASMRSEDAFRELVNRHLSLVYSTALRMGNGDVQMAKDVSQEVFSDLAQQARKIARQSNVAGWLYRHTHFVTSKTIRGERRRHVRESAAMNEEFINRPQDGSELTSILDSALCQLRNEERDAIVLRFFEKNDFRSIGKLLGVSEDAAQKKVSRALDKLRVSLERQGGLITSAGLMLFLEEQAISAPACLMTAVAANALSAGVNISVLSKTLAWATSNMKTLILAALLGTATIPIVWQHQRLAAIQTENEKLRVQIDEFTRMQKVQQAENESRMAEINRLIAENKEIHRLRAEISELHKHPLGPELAKTTKVKAANPNPGEAAEQAPAQFTVETKFINISLEAMRLIEPFATFERSSSKDTKMSLTADELQSLLEKLTNGNGVAIQELPKVTTLDRRQARISMAEAMNVGDQSVDLGPVVDVMPTASADHSLSLTISATCMEFLGWSDPGPKKVPRFRVRQASDTRGVPKEGAVLLGLKEQTAAADYPDTSRIYVLVIPTLIDAAGNRIP